MSEESPKPQKPRPAPCIEFEFEASSKPQVEQILAYEQKQLKGFFSKKPKVSIAQIKQKLESRAAEAQMVSVLMQCVAFYRSSEKKSEALEVLGLLFLEAASKQQVDAGQQKFLLFQTIDLFSMAIQFSPKRVNVPAASMIASVFRIAASFSPNTANIEKEVHKTMNDMVNVKKDPNSLEGRDRIVKLCMKGGRYYEALYHLSELEKVMEASNRALFLAKAGEIHFRKAIVFQNIIDFFSAVVSEEGMRDQLGDLGKIRSFIQRFNMDNSSVKIIPVSGKSPLELNKLIASLIVIANSYYQKSIEEPRFSFKHKAFYAIAHNFLIVQKIQSAVDHLKKALEAVEKSPLKATEKGNERIMLLETIVKVYGDVGDVGKAEEFQQQLQATRGVVRSKEAQERQQAAEAAADSDVPKDA